MVKLVVLILNATIVAYLAFGLLHSRQWAEGKHRIDKCMIVGGTNFGPPPAADQLQSLRQVLPSNMPPDYLAFMARSDGGQVWFDDVESESFDCLRIYSIARMLQLRDTHKDLFPSLLVIGSDQGSLVLGYDLESPHPWPLVMLLPGSGTEHVASSFTELEKRYFLQPGEKVV